MSIQFRNVPYLLLLSIALVGCAEEPPSEERSAVRPVKTVLIAGTGGGIERRYPARIDAGRKAELSFRVPGTVQALMVKEGDLVERGQVVAKLDDKDFQIVVGDRQATFDNARKNYERAKELVEKGHISKMDFDRLEAEFKSAQAALDAAKQDLAYTELRSPFSGMVAKRHIQQFEEVQAKQLILDLQDVTQLEVKFDVPENQIRALRRQEGDEQRSRDRIPVSVDFEGIPGQAFALEFREIATKADEKTQTFQVTYSMDRPEGLSILPGMTANVTLDISAFGSGDEVFRVPVSAIVGDYKLDPQAWVVDEQSMTVQPRSVQVGAMSGGEIQVLDGLNPGDRIVVAGTSFLAEGMKVSLLPETEQAEPRQGE